ncbi:Gfo/Idh/MocA family protein [Amycolatopsis samaneae]|uniref:Gfo/Idh/MocA family protein n=1 Tax=Amycolatopsis samaneae TaxID=664691 RepID=A0ABW5GGI1_9PSEU
MTSYHTAQRLRFGVIGCADIAWRRTLPAMETEPAIDITAIASRDGARAKKFTDRFGGEPFADYKAVAEHEDVDAVYIPLPLMLHAEWIERCLEAGKHVLVEKPMTDGCKESGRLLDLARSRGLVLLENYMFLFHSQHAAVRKLVADGVIGELRGFHSAFTIPPKPPGDIRYQPDVGGGAFLDFGGYPIRAAQHLLGRDLSVVGAVFRRDRKHDVVMSGSVLLASPDGVPAQLTFGMEHSYQNSYALSGSSGRMLLDWVFTPPETHRPVLRIERQDHREEVVLPADHQFARVIRAFVEAVETRAPLREEHEGTLEQAALIEQVQRVARNVWI